ncbi:MAG: zinc finger domain-containing protein [Proteobacteria bacterium]|nr:zinc finger domain-containing protein [Pseudomonadota bacterium]
MKRFEGFEYCSSDEEYDYQKRVNALDLNQDGTEQKLVPRVPGTFHGTCWRCGEEGHFSKNCPTRTQGKDKLDTLRQGKQSNNQYIPLHMIDTDPPTLTQQITTHGIITPEAWVKIQEKVNSLAENNELIDKRQKTLGRSHEKLKRLTKSISKNKTTHPSSTPGENPKQHKKRIDDKRDKKKVKFEATHPSSGNPTKRDKKVNAVHMENSDSSDSETSETHLPDETSVSSDGLEKTKYFDLLSSSSDEYNTDNDDE